MARECLSMARECLSIVVEPLSIVVESSSAVEVGVLNEHCRVSLITDAEPRLLDPPTLICLLPPPFILHPSSFPPKPIAKIPPIQLTPKRHIIVLQVH
jgi:hypothetical protein